jgi:hypothetical protein
MTGRLPALLVLAMAIALPPAAAAGAPDDKGAKPPDGAPNDPNAPLPIRVNQAIDSGVAYLKTKQFPMGNWDTEVQGDVLYDPEAKGSPYVHPTGCTSLALYTLLKCGVPRDDPAIKKGFAWLKKTSGTSAKGAGKSYSFRVPDGTYELAVLILALEAKANPYKREKERESDLKFRLKKGEKLKTSIKLEPEDEAWMKDLVAALVKRQVKSKGWRYGHWTGQAWHNGPRGDSDLSATNLAMLALLAAERCGFQQPATFYQSMLRWTASMQEKDGPAHKRWEPSTNSADERYAATMDKARGFSYLVGSSRDDENQATGSMTACGLANIVICSTILEARDQKGDIFNPELQSIAERSWWDGVAWLDYWWTVDRNVNHNSYHYYYLYCLERACDLKRINLLAGHPWYNEGAQVLVDQQAPGGAWNKSDTHRPHDVLNTCFALLFLNRSTPAITGD